MGVRSALSSVVTGIAAVLLGRLAAPLLLLLLVLLAGLAISGSVVVCTAFAAGVQLGRVRSADDTKSRFAARSGIEPSAPVCQRVFNATVLVALGCLSFATATLAALLGLGHRWRFLLGLSGPLGRV